MGITVLRDIPRGKAAPLDWEVVECVPEKRPGFTFYKVVFRPTADDLRVLGKGGLRSNHFWVQGNRPIDLFVPGYWERALKAAAEGKPYPVVHESTLNLQVNASEGDAYERDSDSAFTSNSTIVDMTSATTAGSRRNGGFYFSGATIPQGATVNSAVWSAVLRGTLYDDPNCTIYFNDVDTANDFTTEADVTSRAVTTASVSYIDTGIANGTNFVSMADVATPLQEVVNRVGFGSTAICLIVKGNSDQTLSFQVWAYDQDPSYGAKLDIDYTGGGGGSSIIPIAQNYYRRRRS